MMPAESVKDVVSYGVRYRVQCESVSHHIHFAYTQELQSPFLITRRDILLCTLIIAYFLNIITVPSKEACLGTCESTRINICRIKYQ